MFSFGQEILVTVLLTYMTDCYPDRAAEGRDRLSVLLRPHVPPPSFLSAAVDQSTRRREGAVYRLCGPADSAVPRGYWYFSVAGTGDQEAGGVILILIWTGKWPCSGHRS